MPPAPAHPEPPDPLLARLEHALRRVAFVPAPSTWQRIRRGLAEHSGAPGRAVARAGVILLCLLILAAIVYVFNQALTDLVIRPV